MWGLASAQHLELHLSFWTYRSRAINHQHSPSPPSLRLLLFDRPPFADNGRSVYHVSLRFKCVIIGQQRFTLVAGRIDHEYPHARRCRVGAGAIHA